MTLEEYLIQQQQKRRYFADQPTQMAAPAISPMVTRPAQILAPPLALNDNKAFIQMPERQPSTMEPTGQPSRMAQFQPNNTASTALNQFLQRPADPRLNPTYKPAPVRDLGAEAHRTGDAALVAGLFGLGLGSRGGVAAAPTLAAAAAGGAQQGADARYQNQVQLVQAGNSQLEDQARQAHQQYIDTLRGLQIGAQDENADNLNQRQMNAEQDAMAARQESDASRAATASDERGRKNRESLIAERGDFMAQLEKLDDASQQKLLDGAERAGDLARLGVDQYFVRGEDGAWSMTLKPRPKDYSPLQDPRALALRDRAKRLQDYLKDPYIDQAYKDKISAELAQVEQALGVGTGQGLPESAFLPMTPAQAGSLSESQANRDQRDRQFASNRELRQAALNLQMMGVDIQNSRLEMDAQKYLTGEKGKWAEKGLVDINKIDTDLSYLSREIAKLRSPRVIPPTIPGMDPTIIQPSRDQLDAAEELVKIMNDKMVIQEAVAGRYGYKRNPSTGRGFVPLAGSGSRKPPPPKGSSVGAVTLPPITGTTPSPSLFSVLGK